MQLCHDKVLACSGNHEGRPYPERVRKAPQSLPKGLRMPGDPHDTCLPQVQLGLIHCRHLERKSSKD